MKKYPAVEKLIAAVREHQLTFSFPDTEPALQSQFYVRLKMDSKGNVVSVPVMDEFEDVPANNPVMLLHLLLQECELFEEAKDFLTWAADVGLNANLPVVLNLYEELTEVVPEVRNIFGAKLKAIPLYDMEFNTGVARALRKATVYGRR